MAEAGLFTLADYLREGYWASTGNSAHQWASNDVTWGWGSITSAQAGAAINALAQWARVANINFVFTDDNPNITFTNTGGGAATGDTYDTVTGATISATVNISASWDTSWGAGSYGYQTFIHEIGHALGLGHQGPYNNGDGQDPEVVRLWDNDTLQFSIMSYVAQSNFDGASDTNLVSPMLADIIAIQRMYGANPFAATGNTRYGWNATSDGYGLFDTVGAMTPAAFTIYDTGGDDTFDVSGSTFRAEIDLDIFAFSSVAGLSNNVAIAGGTVIENAIGGSGNDLILGNPADNVLSGSAGNDRLDGRGGDDFINAGADDDVVIGGSGDDFLDGGSIHTQFGDIESAGVDTVDYAGALGSVSVDLNLQVGGFVTIGGAQNTGGAGIDTLRYFENLTGSSFGDALRGDASANVITGLGGNDFIDGRGGADTVSYATAGGVVNVQLWLGQATGAAGSDSIANVENIIGSDFSDTLIGDRFVNAIYGGFGDDIVEGQEGADYLDGGRGTDRVSYFDNAGVTVRLDLGWAIDGVGTTDTLVDIENVNGSGSADLIVGDGGDNDVNGITGDDAIEGGAGFDILRGGGGDDTLQGGADFDTLDGGDGDDTASFADAAVGVTVFLDDGHAQDGLGSTDVFISIESVLGSSHADDLKGTSEANRLAGADGDDRLQGSGGDDRLQGGGGADRVLGGRGDDNVQGGGGADQLEGNQSDDRLDGGDGNDRLDGGAGDDVMTSGAGLDILAFLGSFGHDQVVDFANGNDRLDLDAGLRFRDLTILRVDADADGARDDVAIAVGRWVFDLLDTGKGSLDGGDFLF